MLKPTILPVFFTSLFAITVYAKAQTNKYDEFKQHAGEVFKKCQELRESSSYMFHFDASHNRKYDKEFQFLNDEWVVKNIKTSDSDRPVTFNIRNAEFAFALTPKKRDGFALLQARRVGVNIYTDPKARDEIWFIEAASSVLPIVSLLETLDNPRCELESFSTNGDQGYLLEIYDEKGVCLKFPEARARIKLDNSFRVTKSEVRFLQDGEHYTFVFSVDYANTSENPYIPSRIEYTRSSDGSADVDKFLVSNIKYRKIEFDKKLLTSEYYGIPRSALEAMAPLPPHENGSLRTWIWLVVAVGFLFSSWFFFRRKR